MIESSMIPTLGGAEHNQLPLMLSGKPAAVFQKYLNALSAPELMYCISVSLFACVVFYEHTVERNKKRHRAERRMGNCVKNQENHVFFIINFKRSSIQMCVLLSIAFTSLHLLRMKYCTVSA